MVSSDISEESNDWVEIENSLNQPSSPLPQQQRLEYELIIRDNFYDDGSFVFPPSEHEDLPLVEDEEYCYSPRIMSSTRSPLSSACSEVSPPKDLSIQSSDSTLSVMMNRIGTGMYTLGRRMYRVFLCSSRGYSYIVPASAMTIAALLLYVKILQWRKRILHLLREKDQRISQLMHQIAHMNEILSARRKVPVLRI
ncbi:unnamed protein product [Amaranthus hypochondriacus]